MGNKKIAAIYADIDDLNYLQSKGIGKSELFRQIVEDIRIGKYKFIHKQTH